MGTATSCCTEPTRVVQTEAVGSRAQILAMALSIPTAPADCAMKDMGYESAWSAAYFSERKRTYADETLEGSGELSDEGLDEGDDAVEEAACKGRVAQDEPRLVRASKAGNERGTYRRQGVRREFR